MLRFCHVGSHSVVLGTLGSPRTTHLAHKASGGDSFKFQWLIGLRSVGWSVSTSPWQKKKVDFNLKWYHRIIHPTRSNQKGIVNPNPDVFPHVLNIFSHMFSPCQTQRAAWQVVRAAQRLLLHRLGGGLSRAAQHGAGGGGGAQQRGGEWQGTKKRRGLHQ